MQPQLEMLLECYEIMGRRFNRPKMAMNALVQWMAYAVSVESHTDVATPTLTLQMLDDLNATFDAELLRSDPWDYLGDLALYLKLNNWLGNTWFASKDETLKWAAKNIPLQKLQPWNIFFDPQAGSGRLCLALYNLGANCIMAAAETAAKPYRLLTINQKLYGLTLFALYGSCQSPFDSVQWLKANLYIPCHTAILRQNQVRKEQTEPCTP